MKDIKPHILAKAACLCAALLAMGLMPVPALAATKVRLQLKWYHQFQFAGYYMALQKGYYAAEGLEVEILERKPGSNTEQAVEAGDVEFGVESPDLIVARSQGRKVKVVAAIFQHSPEVLIANTDTLAELEGKRVMLSVQNNIGELAMLKKQGVTMGDMILVPPSQRIEDFINGRVAAVSAYSTNELYLLDQKGVKYNVFPVHSYGIDFYGDCLFTSDAYAEAHPETVEAFLRATRLGWHYAFDHPDEAIWIIKDKYHSRKTLEALSYEASAMRQLVLPDVVEIGHMDARRWKLMEETYADLGFIQRDFDVREMLYVPSGPMGRRERNIILALLGAVALVFAVMEVMRRRLDRMVVQRTSELERLLAEKDVLLKEVHHRVKNNMAVISSLLSLQSTYVQDKRYLEMFEECQGRIQSMALVHEHLYRSRDFTSIEAAPYIAALVDNVRHLFGGAASEVRVEVVPVSINIDELVPLGLIVNELVNNAYRHGRSAQGEPFDVEVSLKRHPQREGVLVLQVLSRGGAGLAPDFDPARCSGLGLKLVVRLARQLEGALLVQDSPVRFTVEFMENIKHTRLGGS